MKKSSPATQSPIVLLIRVLNPPRWEWYGAYADNASAERAYRREIQGRGITAWACWVPRKRVEQLLRTGEAP